MNGNNQFRHHLGANSPFQMLVTEVAEYLGVSYQIQLIGVGTEEKLVCVVMHSKKRKTPEKSENGQHQCFFVGHGFGGSSLMNFPILEPLLQRGTVILWEIRGLGFSPKLASYPQFHLAQTQNFFLQTILALLSHFQPRNTTFICHSFGAYLTMRFLLKHPSFVKNHVKQLILLSPIGITPASDDYKNKINSCSDIFHFIVSKIGWTFRITYKWVINKVLCFLREGLIDNYLRELEIEDKGRQIMKKIVHALVDESEGSEPLFFQYFRERVLPKVPLEPLMSEGPSIRVVVAYGGRGDWVDQKGSVRLAAKFPLIRLFQLQECGHNIMFKRALCVKFLTEMLAHDHQ